MQARRGRRAVALGGELPPGAARRAASPAARGAAITLLYGVAMTFTIEQRPDLPYRNSPGGLRGLRPIRAGPSRTRRRAAGSYCRVPTSLSGTKAGPLSKARIASGRGPKARMNCQVFYKKLDKC